MARLASQVYKVGIASPHQSRKTNKDHKSKLTYQLGQIVMKTTKDLMKGWNWCQNFKVLELNQCKKLSKNQIDINFKMLGLKKLFTLLFCYHVEVNWSNYIFT